MQKKRKLSKFDAVYSLEIEPLSKREKIKKEFFKDLKAHPARPERHSRKNAFIAIGANLVIPGLGNYYLKRNKLGIAMAALSVLFIIIFISPFFPVNSIGTVLEPSSPQPITIASAFYGNQEACTYYGSYYNPFSAYFFIPMFLIAFSWLHLIFLIAKGKK